MELMWFTLALTLAFSTANLLLILHVRKDMTKLNSDIRTEMTNIVAKQEDISELQKKVDAGMVRYVKMVDELSIKVTNLLMGGQRK